MIFYLHPFLEYLDSNRKNILSKFLAQFVSDRCQKQTKDENE